MGHDSSTHAEGRERPQRDDTARDAGRGDLVIDRCVCFDLRFSDLKKKLDERPASMDQIARRYGCGSCCGICRPYIERMLESGETVFTEVLHADSDKPSERR
jgi:bacterioferritin-associated ferredoxin